MRRSEKKEEQERLRRQAQIREIQKDFDQKVSLIIPDIKKAYSAVRSSISIPANCEKIDIETTVFGFKHDAFSFILKKKDFYIWNENNTLHIFPTEEQTTEKYIRDINTINSLSSVDYSDIKHICIPHNEIDYYCISGERTSEMTIQTANTGTNYKGAVIGGLLAGEAGAIIGSQHGKNNVYSTTTHQDKRFVELLYTQNGATRRLNMSFSALPLLETWFPDKKYEYVLTRKQATNTNTDPFEEVKKYKELFDNGIITEEQFESKKKELLNL